ncbi:MAG: hypothetical protein KDD77_11925, partial [Caldilineaceae bacterium]|nr:hypothetical protein [Caldilineaceae bacterium]
DPARIEQRGAPPPGQRWFLSDLGKRHKTPAETAAEEAAAAEEEKYRQWLEELEKAEPEEEAPSPYMDGDPDWRALASDLNLASMVRHYFAGLVEIADKDGVPLYRIAVSDLRELEWVKNRLSLRIARSLSRIVGQPVEVEFVPPLEVRP